MLGAASGLFVNLPEELEEKPTVNHFIGFLDKYTSDNLEFKKQVFLIQNPLSIDIELDDNEFYECAVLLSPKHKIVFLNFSKDIDRFEEYKDIFMENISYLSKKYGYERNLGRTVRWKKDLIAECAINESEKGKNIFDDNFLEEESERRKVQFVISLLTGSINDINVKDIAPSETLLDKVKQQIVLFDGNQTRFLYKEVNKKKVVVQGLSGTGKTELLLHKLKEIYPTVSGNKEKVFFTCHNKILSKKLKERIPGFFNFMKVSEQIEWNIKLWCEHAWGSRNDSNSGFYRYICNFYSIPFLNFGDSPDFDYICGKALKEINKNPDNDILFALDYLFVDESQDFGESFYALCDRVVRKKIFIAGDIFQSIFGSNKSSTPEADYLLNQCYRTAPKTLMFAHGLSMGLFEDVKRRWPSDEQWTAFGYAFSQEGDYYKVTREPIRRFEDINYDAPCLEIHNINNLGITAVADLVVKIVCDLKEEHVTILPGDIAVISHKTSRAYNNALSAYIQEALDAQGVKWEVNRAFETKEYDQERICITNHNHVKGLEFPFVIYVGPDGLTNISSHRNSIYMAVTRSFIKSYALISMDLHLFQTVEKSLSEILETGIMTVKEPGAHNKKLMEQIELEIDNNSFRSNKEVFYELLDDYNPSFSYIEKERAFGSYVALNGNESDFDTMSRFVNSGVLAK